MRQLIVSCNVTVDGFMAGPHGDLDFIADDPRLEDALAARFRSVADTVVVGRRTFEDMRAYWTTVDSAMARWLQDARKVVLTTDGDFDVSGWDNATLAAGDGLSQVSDLKQTEGGALVAFGGVRTLRALVAADLVDEYWLKISPVIMGRGLSMFSDIAKRGTPTLRSAQAHRSGIIDAAYAA